MEKVISLVTAISAEVPALIFWWIIFLGGEGWGVGY